MTSEAFNGSLGQHRAAVGRGEGLGIEVDDLFAGVAELLVLPGKPLLGGYEPHFYYSNACMMEAPVRPGMVTAMRGSPVPTV